jgi:transcriptional regulatory protein LevR
MALDIGEVLALLEKLTALGAEIGTAWNQMQEHLQQEHDEKKRKALLDACAARDGSAIRTLLYSVGQ